MSVGWLKKRRIGEAGGGRRSCYGCVHSHGDAMVAMPQVVGQLEAKKSAV